MDMVKWAHSEFGKKPVKKPIKFTYVSRVEIMERKVSWEECIFMILVGFCNVKSCQMKYLLTKCEVIHYKVQAHIIYYCNIATFYNLWQYWYSILMKERLSSQDKRLHYSTFLRSYCTVFVPGLNLCGDVASIQLSSLNICLRTIYSLHTEITVGPQTVVGYKWHASQVQW